jgi:hypothetical protein
VFETKHICAAELENDAELNENGWLQNNLAIVSGVSKGSFLF